MLTYTTFPTELRDKIPGFADVFEEHVRDYDEVLPHVLLGDLVRFVRDRLEKEGVESDSVRQALDLLEGGLASPDRKLNELVAVSFVENLEDSDVALMRDMFGPRLKQQLPTGITV